MLKLFKSYQDHAKSWAVHCFGESAATDAVERRQRFQEEAIELVQATGGTLWETIQLAKYVYGRPVGRVKQEVGGTLLTLALLCESIGIDMNNAGAEELARVWRKIDKIQAKQAAKPKLGGPLPSAVTATRLVIVESPFAGKGLPEQECSVYIEYARAAVRDCLCRGEAPIASHLLYTQEGVLHDDVPHERQQGIEAGLAWLNVADATAVYEDFGVSEGMQCGVARAIASGVPVERRMLGSDWKSRINK
jgi:NTP pyrophosphatase (non-canonical NTP hydrolase)